MQCEICQENPASVYVTDLEYSAETPHGELGKLHSRSVCDACASELNLPHAQTPGQNKAVLFKLLQKTAQRAKKPAAPGCTTCGMTMAEFRSEGRVGCADCYTVFREHIDALLVRMHQAQKHVGRGPGETKQTTTLSERLTRLTERMDLAIRAEDYEGAAKLRDELMRLKEAPQD